MIEINTKIKKWGNSLGLIIPKDITRKQHIRPKQDIRVFIEKSGASTVSDVFGIGRKLSTRKALEKVDKLFGD